MREKLSVPASGDTFDMVGRIRDIMGPRQLFTPVPRTEGVRRLAHGTVFRGSDDLGCLATPSIRAKVIGPNARILLRS